MNSPAQNGILHNSASSPLSPHIRTSATHFSSPQSPTRHNTDNNIESNNTIGPPPPIRLSDTDDSETKQNKKDRHKDRNLEKDKKKHSRQKSKDKERDGREHGKNNYNDAARLEKDILDLHADIRREKEKTEYYIYKTVDLEAKLKKEEEYSRSLQSDFDKLERKLYKKKAAYITSNTSLISPRQRGSTGGLHSNLEDFKHRTSKLPSRKTLEV